MKRSIMKRTGVFVTGTLLVAATSLVASRSAAAQPVERADPESSVMAERAPAETAWVVVEAAMGLGHQSAIAAGASLAAVEPRFVDYGRLQEVDGDELYAEGRELLRRGQFAEAAAVFEALRESFPNSVLVGDSFYYQAFALYRHGRHQQTDSAEARRALERATGLIEQQSRQHANAATRSDAEALSMRLAAAMAERGDVEAGNRIRRGSQEACDSEKEDMRALALSALINMDPDRAEPLLREVIADRNECNGELRAQAVFILSQHDAEGVVDLLLDLAHRNPDPDPEVREAAVHWLGQSNRPEAVDALFAILGGSDDPDIQEGALFALSQTGDPRAREALRNLAQDETVSSDLRSTAIFWLVQQDEAAVSFLIDLFGTIEDRDVREQIVFSVGQAKTAESRAWLRSRALDENEDPGVRGQAVFWMAQSGGADDDATAAALKSIYDGTVDTEVKEQVLFGLSQIKSAAAVDILMDVARSDPDTNMRSSAVFFLGQSDDPRVPEFLMSLIRG